MMKIEEEEELKVTEITNWGEDPLYWTYLYMLNIYIQQGLLPKGNSSWEEVNLQRERLKSNHTLPKNGRVINFVHIIGTLVRVQTNNIMKTLTIDDGTALIDCIEWGSEEEKKENGYLYNGDLILGQSLRCFGRLEWPAKRFQTCYRTPCRRIILTRPPCLVDNIHEELRHWSMAMKYWETIYSAPYTPLLTQNNTVLTSNSILNYKYGGLIEDVIMDILYHSPHMPLISSEHEVVIREKYPIFLKTCFQSASLEKEEKISQVLLEQGMENTVLPLKNLCKNGLILSLDPRYGLFCLITHDEFIGPGLLRVMLKSSVQYSYISHTRLIELFREDLRLRTVSTKRINSSLSRLLLEGCIIEGPEPDTFALVTTTTVQTS